MPVRVLHVAPIASDHRLSGLFHSIPPLLRRLQDEETDVALLTTRASRFNDAQPYPVFHISELGRWPTLRHCPRPYDRPDLVVFNSTYIRKQAILARECRGRSIPYIIAPRGGMTEGAQSVKRWKKHLGNLLFFSRMVGGAAAIRCLTRPEAADAEAWGRPVFVVGNGTHLPSAAQVASPGTHRELRFLFIGRLDPYHKGLDLLLRAWRLVRSDLGSADASLTIHGPSIEGSRDALRALVREWELGDRVSVQGPVFAEDKVDALSSADVFVHPSRFEGHPMAVLEALSYGLPCLLTPGTNMADEVVAAEAGWHADPAPEGIARALVAVVQARSLLPAMGENARSLAGRQYTWGQIAHQLRERYVDVIRRKKRGLPRGARDGGLAP